MKPFFLGAFGGLALSLALALGLYLSPLRKALYLEWDPELAGLRSRTEQIRERMQAGELGMAEGAASAASGAGAAVDSLRRAQAGAWKEYRHWRNRLGELSRAHDLPGPASFPAWAYSLRYGLGPLAALLSLAPALFFAVRSARDPSRASRAAKAPPKVPPRPQPDPAEALSSFRSAVRQVASIASPPLPPAARPVADPRRAPPRAVAESRPAAVEPLPPAEGIFRVEAPSDEPSPYDVASDHGDRGAGAEPPSGAAPRPEALETQILNLGPGGWGEPRLSAGMGTTVRPGEAGGLSMEDEDGDAAQDGNPSPEANPAGAFDEAASAGTQGHFMPPTTEVERVERRKAEVVKLARKGMTSSEISRRLRISQDQVEFILRLRREKG